MSDMGDMITVTGNVGTAPELKHTPAGVPITTFRLARGLRRFDREAGAWSDAGTSWYTVSVFRDLADHAFASLKKGDRVIVSGRLRVRDWEAGSSKGTAVEIDADAIGHDLRWGTTTFVKDARGNRGGAAHGDAWAAPGVDANEREQGAREVEPAAAPLPTPPHSAGGEPPREPETPF
ncbi:single-stranded DNA-binding protein [Microbacterium atlanticum]|uniref:single-stranded DNA-binding protein n=1 Tax=Microbacterium atlanticum TaxID=2782168 RepID=UPI0018880652|nr:single-stranded DNA-binding protein [Microbacterium atlanticum]